MYVKIYIFIYIYIYIYIQIYIHRLFSCACTCVQIYLCLRICVFVPERIDVPLCSQHARQEISATLGVAALLHTLHISTTQARYSGCMFSCALSHLSITTQCVIEISRPNITISNT